MLIGSTDERMPRSSRANRVVLLGIERGVREYPSQVTNRAARVAARADEWSQALRRTGNRERLRTVPERFEVVALWGTDNAVTYTFRRGFAEISPDLPIEYVTADRKIWRDATGPDGPRYDLTQLNPRELPFGTILSGISDEGTVRVRVRGSATIPDNSASSVVIFPHVDSVPRVYHERGHPRMTPTRRTNHGGRQKNAKLRHHPIPKQRDFRPMDPRGTVVGWVCGHVRDLK